MKKILAAVLAGVMALSATACSSSSTKKIESPDDFAGAKVSVQTGTTAHDALQKMQEEGVDVEILPYEKITQCFDDVSLGRADAVYVDSVVAAYYLADDDSKFQSVWKSDEGEPMGVCIKKGRKLTIWQTILLFVFTAGVSLNNGLKTYLAALFTNGRKFFGIKYFLLGIILPAALMWGFARWEYRTFVWPKEMARHEAKIKKNKEATAKIYQQYRDTAQVKDSAKVEAAVKKIIKDKAHAKYVRDHKQIWNKNTGKPIAKGEFMNWTDKTTSRGETLVENFFGEGIMLHQQNLLGDVLRNRPVIVKYQSPVNYVIEACIVLLFVLGILAGRKSKFLWLTLTFFLMDTALHIGLGFGINEVYIMTAHYMYALPIAIAFLALKAKGKSIKWAFRGLMLAITLYLWISNGYLLVGYMLG